MAENKCFTSNRAGAVVPIVDFNRCEGKDACVVVCPYDVFEVRKIDREDYRHLTFIREGQRTGSIAAWSSIRRALTSAAPAACV